MVLPQKKPVIFISTVEKITTVVTKTKRAITVRIGILATLTVMESRSFTPPALMSERIPFNQTMVILVWIKVISRGS